MAIDIVSYLTDAVKKYKASDVFIITEFEGQRNVRKDSIEGYQTTDDTTKK